LRGLHSETIQSLLQINIALSNKAQKRAGLYHAMT
jgi:hypothetical protein